MKLKEILKKIEDQFILWLARQLPDCKYMTAQFSKSLDRPQTLRQRATMRLHLYTCAACRRYLVQIKLMHELLVKSETPPKTEVLSNEARKRIEAALAATLNRQS